MFILNFEVMTDNELQDPNQNLNHKLPLPWLSSGRPRAFKLRLPLLRSLSNSKQSLQEDPEAGRVRDASHRSHESLALGELLSLPEQQPRPALQWPEDQRTLLGLDSEPAVGLALTVAQSSPHPHPHRLNPEASISNCSLTHSRSRESFHSMRRASSVDDIEAMRPEWDRKFRTRPGSTGAVNHKSNILNSTSDSDLMRYRTISKIPQITLNFVDFKPDPLIALPTGEMDIIAPCKLIDRTHNVTEKVTQLAVLSDKLGDASLYLMPLLVTVPHIIVSMEPAGERSVSSSRLALIIIITTVPSLCSPRAPRPRRDATAAAFLPSHSQQVNPCQAGRRFSLGQLGFSKHGE
ncbi:hypothetical protein AGOR_G00174590 [Albula goreensis]|uniref:Uncharacterized protein n=1 Tax=Albula goreensis TaxID=1534307 RepID=A0A8T3D048_9TELE|nr:hypothetical protein AGOR_G00174590 [Albula goreensis]